MDKSTRGGAGRGQGRKKKQPLAKVTLTVDKDAYESAKKKLGKDLKLSEKVTALLKNIADGQ